MIPVFSKVNIEQYSSKFFLLIIATRFGSLSESQMSLCNGKAGCTCTINCGLFKFTPLWQNTQNAAYAIRFCQLCTCVMLYGPQFFSYIQVQFCRHMYLCNVSMDINYYANITYCCHSCSLIFVHNSRNNFHRNFTFCTYVSMWHIHWNCNVTCLIRI